MICPGCKRSYVLTNPYAVVNSHGITYECKVNVLLDTFYKVDDQFIDDVDSIIVVCICGYELVATPNSTHFRISGKEDYGIFRRTEECAG